MSRRRAVAFLVLLATAMVLVYSLLRQTRAPAVDVQADSLGPQYVLQDAELTRYGANGAPEIRAHAVQLDQYRSGRTTGENLRVTTLDPLHPWTATAPHGDLQRRGQPIYLYGDVQAHGRWPDTLQPLTITSAHLWLDPATHELHTNALVTLTSSGRTGTAERGMRANWLAHSLLLLGKVHMNYEVPASR